MFLYNLWVISGWNAGGTDGTNDDVYIRPPITIDRMMGAFNIACKQMIIEKIVSDMFFLKWLPNTSLVRLECRLRRSCAFFSGACT